MILNPERTLIEHLGDVDRIAGALARRHGLEAGDVEDLSAWVKLRLVEDDYAILRKFRGESQLTTYLTVVIASLYRDYRAQRWGRWRPSAAARRRGEVALRLEALVYRRGYRLSEAGELLRTAGVTSLSDGELAGILRQLPRRTPLRPLEVGIDAAAQGEARAADASVVLENEDAVRLRIEACLQQAIAELPDEDRLIVQLRFWNGLSVADIARALHLDQKPLYRRLERLIGALKSRLLALDISAEQLRELLSIDTE